MMEDKKLFNSEQICNMLGVDRRARFALNKKWQGQYDSDFWSEALIEYGLKNKFDKLIGK